jgi:hypothetical protein
LRRSARLVCGPTPSVPPARPHSRATLAPTARLAAGNAVGRPAGHSAGPACWRLPRPGVVDRYYGTTRCDALPRDRDGWANFDQGATSVWIEIAPPAPPWLFPLDLPWELLRWLGEPGSPAAVRVELPTQRSARQAATELANAELNALVGRAEQARIQR